MAPGGCFGDFGAVVFQTTILDLQTPHILPTPHSTDQSTPNPALVGRPHPHPGVRQGGFEGPRSPCLGAAVEEQAAIGPWVYRNFAEAVLIPPGVSHISPAPVMFAISV